MWRILQQDAPDDYVLATGELHSVRELVELAFEMVGRRIEWHSKGVDEKGIDAITGAELVAIDPKYFRPTEVDLLLGDATRARERLSWRHTIPFHEMVAEMVREDLKLIARDQDRKRGDRPDADGPGVRLCEVRARDHRRDVEVEL
jgi:GDPmannose 4,6-dehydratase